MKIKQGGKLDKSIIQEERGLQSKKGEGREIERTREKDRKKSEEERKPKRPIENKREQHGGREKKRQEKVWERNENKREQKHFNSQNCHHLTNQLKVVTQTD